MAAKESQGLQAIIIILAIGFLGLLVGVFLVNNARKTAVAQASSARDDAQKARTEMGAAQSEANTYKQWMGFDEGASFAALEEFHKEDMEKFGANMAEESRKYRTIIENIHKENRELVLNEATAKDQVRQLKDNLLAVESQKEEQVKKFEAAMQKASDDLAAEKKKFQQQYEAVNTEKDQIAKDLNVRQAKIDELQEKVGQQKSDFEAKAINFERSIATLREGLPDVDQFAQPADGRINWVNQREQTVWIDLGSADGLRPQVTFSVAEAGLGDAEAAAKEGKGSIEVVRILGDHMAEARITQDNSTNPLIPGDRIYSQVWDRGRQVGFGIAGFIDIDKDGSNDLERLKNIIAASNGRVVASPDESGAMQGEMDINTRFLVLGEYPNSPRRVAYRNSYDALEAEAKRLGIETIGLDEFLHLMGWEASARTVSLGADARPEDFPPRPFEEATPRESQQPTGVFEKRLPPVTY